MRFIIESWGPEGQDNHGETNDLDMAIGKAQRFARKRPGMEFTVTDTTDWEEVFSCIYT